ncbi:membrane protein [Arthrobacter phage Altadena]|uniref:Membrane protein n=1 Tax=Arthrobacter phage Altadena TaxID=3059064 RepID=A0AA96KHR8_9CAUD|nr:membrane protein [Arthrobacter phage Altadena]
MIGAEFWGHVLNGFAGWLLGVLLAEALLRVVRAVLRVLSRRRAARRWARLKARYPELLRDVHGIVIIPGGDK